MLFAWAVETFLAWNSGWSDTLLVYVPFGVAPTIPYYLSPPLSAPYEQVHLFAPAAALAFAVIASFVWPTSARLATRFFVILSSIELIRSLGIAPSLSTLSLLFEHQLTPTYPELSLSSAALLLSASSILLYLMTRLLIRTLGASLEIERRPERLRIVLLTLAVPLALIALPELIARYPTGPAASAWSVLALLVASWPSPRGAWPATHSHELRKPVLIVALTGAILITTSLAVFGGPLTGSGTRVVLIGNEVEWVRHDEMLARQLRDPESLERLREMRFEWSDPQEQRGENND